MTGRAFHRNLELQAQGQQNPNTQQTLEQKRPHVGGLSSSQDSLAGSVQLAADLGNRLVRQGNAAPLVEVALNQPAGSRDGQFSGLLSQTGLGGLTGLGDLVHGELLAPANGRLELLLGRYAQGLGFCARRFDDGFGILQRIALALLVFGQQLLRFFPQVLGFLQLLADAIRPAIETGDHRPDAHAKRDGQEDDKGDGDPEIFASEHQRRASIASSTADRLAAASGLTAMSFCVTACATSEAISASSPPARRTASSMAASSARVCSACWRPKISRRAVCSDLISSLLALRMPPASDRALASAFS